MDYYNSNDFSSMQQEALKRVHEMQQRSKNIINSNPPPNTNHQEPHPTPANNQPKNNVPHHHNHNENNHKKQSGSLQGLLDGLLNTGEKKSEKGELFNIAGIDIDEEKALIGMLIYILYKQGSDIKLLLALGYLLL